MKTIFTMAAFFVFAAMFGLALVATHNSRRYESDLGDEDER